MTILQCSNFFFWMRIFKLIKNTYSEIAFKIGLLSMCIFKITISQSFTFSSYTVLCKLLTPDIYEVWLQNITSQILNFPNPSTRNFQFFFTWTNISALFPSANVQNALRNHGTSISQLDFLRQNQFWTN